MGIGFLDANVPELDCSDGCTNLWIIKKTQLHTENG